MIEKRREKWRWAVWLGMLILILVALVLWQRTPKFEEVIVEDESPEAVKILFIGNSLTFLEHVPAQFVDIARAQNADQKLVVKQVAYPDYTLRDHWNRKRAVKAIEAEDWDYVVLQGHSKEPIKQPKVLRQYVKLFDEEIQEAHAKTILYTTWTDFDRQDLHDQILKVFDGLSKNTNITMAPVGESMYLCLKKYPDITLLQPDKHHATDNGAYLVAATLYMTIFRNSIKVDTSNLPLANKTIDPSIQKRLDEIALAACQLHHLNIKTASE
ncbi:MAG: hypothetical protein R3C24_19910, partial [Cyanobacteriota/Melainabacteria group bacterium]